MIMFNFSSIL